MTCNNWFSKYFSSNFGKYPVRLSELLIFWEKHLTVMYFLNQKNNSYDMEQLGFKIVLFHLWYISWKTPPDLLFGVTAREGGRSIVFWAQLSKVLLPKPFTNAIWKYSWYFLRTFFLMVFVESQIETNSIYLCLITLLRRFFCFATGLFFFIYFAFLISF